MSLYNFLQLIIFLSLNRVRWLEPCNNQTHEITSYVYTMYLYSVPKYPISFSHKPYCHLLVDYYDTKLRSYISCSQLLPCMRTDCIGGKNLLQIFCEWYVGLEKEGREWRQCAGVLKTLYIDCTDKLNTMHEKHYSNSSAHLANK